MIRPVWRCRRHDEVTLLMFVFGVEHLGEVAGGGPASVKMVFNTQGALLFPPTDQHRDQKMAGISYEDDYRGNALAAVLTNGQIEIRFHKNFSDAQVVNIVHLLASTTELSLIRDWRIIYQGRQLAT